jgi:hypothetical protein
MLDRRLFRDPPPLPPTEPEYINEEACLGAQDTAIHNMRAFDRLSAPMRRVGWEANNTTITQMLYAEGYRTPESAAVKIRQMLEREAAVRLPSRRRSRGAP